MNPLIPKDRKSVLSRSEKIQEATLLILSILACLLIFAQIVFA
ncbi:MAG: hypothetical protein AAGM67_03250 [Bacteroidota bacterium]